MQQAKLLKAKRKLFKEQDRLRQTLDQPVTNSVNHTHVTRVSLGDYDRDTRASEVAMYSDGISLRSLVAMQLRDVEQALRSIDQGTYGVCKWCHQVIDQSRLLIRPSATFCVECQDRQRLDNLALIDFI